MRSDERGSKSGVFRGTEGRMVNGTRSEGGCSRISGLGLPQLHSSTYLIPLWLAILKRPYRVPGAACRAGTRAPPPPKQGGHVTLIAVLSTIPLSRPHGVALVLIYPCGKACKNPPFPSRFIVSDRSSPSRVRFAASRPGRLRSDPVCDHMHVRLPVPVRHDQRLVPLQSPAARFRVGGGA